MEINRELDAWVAENVFGIEKCFHIHWKYTERNNAVCGDCAAVFGSDTSLWIEQAQLKHYTTDPAAAFEVLRALLLQDWEITELAHHDDAGFAIMAGCSARTIEASAETLELTICHLAKKAKQPTKPSSPN